MINIILNQDKLIPIRWNTTNRVWYTNLGYTYTKYRDIFFVKQKHLTPQNKTRVDVKCDYCGEFYNTEYGTYYKGHQNFPKDCCSKCTGKKTSDVTYFKRREKYWGELEDFCKSQGYTLETQKDEYTDVKMTIYYSCSKHGETSNMMENMLHGFGCQKCGREHAKNKMIFTPDFIEEYINSINENTLLNKFDYQGAPVPNLNIKCKCGNIFTTSFNNYKHGTNTCKTCSLKESRNETVIRKILENNNIDFIQEKRFSDCKDKKSLPFDFYIPSINLIIEYDGEQHYFCCSFNGIPSNLSIIQKHDKIKNDYCNKKHINLLRIPYWEKENIENIVLDKIYSLTKLQECI